MSVITKENYCKTNNHLITQILLTYNQYRRNIYEIDGLYSISFTNLELHNPDVSKKLKNLSHTNKMHANFYLKNPEDWNRVYLHFTQHFNEFSIFSKNNYLNEMFCSDTKTRMFFDLDFKNITLEQVNKYIDDLIKRVESYIGFKVNYIVTKNDNGDLSRHVILTNVILPNINQCKSLAKQFKDNFVDLHPYRNKGSLRCFNSNKICDNGLSKKKVLDRANYPISSDETYLIQPYIPEEPNFSMYEENKDKNIAELLDDEVNDMLTDIDLTKIGFTISGKVDGYNNLFNLTKFDTSIECPICARCHDKNDANYLVVTSHSVILKCHRSSDDSHILKTSNKKFKLYKYLESITPIKYDFLNQVNCQRYSNERAQMPENIEGNCLYLVSPCKSGKTKCIHDYIQARPDLKVCFITMQRKFTRNLHERFLDLGFNNYLDEGFNPNHDRIIISLYSLHVLPDLNKFDLVVIDEIESMLVNFCSVGTLGQPDKKRLNLENYKILINNVPQIILMDAYPSRECINHFNIFNRRMQIYFNEYQTHKNDTIYCIENYDLFINEMALSLSMGQKIVFASALKKKQKQILDKVLHTLTSQYNMDVSKLNVIMYNADMDHKLMDESIKNLNKDWCVDLLAYSPCVTAGISFELKHFDKCFYLGFPNSGHISALQSIYRVRDLSKCEYYFHFGRKYNIESQIYDKSEINKLSEFNKMNLKDVDLLDYDVLYSDFGCEVRKSNNINNRILENSDSYLMSSKKNYYNKLIGQFLYNGSKVVFRNKKYISENYSDINGVNEDDVKEYFKLHKIEKFSDIICNKLDSQVKLTQSDFNNKLSDKEFEELKLLGNKTKQQDAVLKLNTYIRMFPQMSLDKYPIIEETPAKFYRYYNSYNRYSRYVGEEIETFVHFKKNKCDPMGLNDEPLQRFRIQVVSKFLQRLAIDDTLTYQELHNREYKDIELDELRDGLEYIFDEVLNGDEKLISIFIREFYTTRLQKSKPRPDEFDTLKKITPIINNMLDGSFGLKVVPQTERRQKTERVNFIRHVELF